MNNRIPNPSVTLQSGYQLHISTHQNTLQDYIKSMDEIRCDIKRGKSSLK